MSPASRSTRQPSRHRSGTRGSRPPTTALDFTVASTNPAGPEAVYVRVYTGNAVNALTLVANSTYYGSDALQHIEFPADREHHLLHLGDHAILVRRQDLSL